MSSIKCPAKMSKYYHAVFLKSPAREWYYDVETPDESFPFSWFRLSEPKNEFLIRQGAKKVAESFNGQSKVLFTGLRNLSNTAWYAGDTFIKGKKSLVLFHYNHVNESFGVYVFPVQYPRANGKIIRFIRVLHEIENARRKPDVSMFNQTDGIRYQDAKVMQKTIQP